MPGLAIRGDMSAAELRRFAQTSADRRAGMRALAIAGALDGKSRAEAAAVIGRERQSLRDAILRYNAEGLDGLRDRPGGGARPRLSAAQCDELKAWITRGPDPERDGVSTYRLADIAEWIARQWGVRYTLSGLSKLLHRLGLSWQKARPSHPEGDAEAREAFKKTSRPGWRKSPPRIPASSGKSGVRTRRAKARKGAPRTAGSTVASARLAAATSVSNPRTSSPRCVPAPTIASR